MEFIQTIIDGITWIIDFIYVGIYEFIQEVMQELVAWLVIAKLQTMLFLMEFSWGVAKQILINLNIGDYIQQGFSDLDPVLMGYLNFFRVPESLNLIVQAIATRVTLKVMGWQ
ncbi:DUF2523 family protein [Cellvibrio sp. OA-2007]|uniref:DUF2523 family protein n=1 Tax=Cellvibrio sp. OA-2007 TaxID=529823 RepID=UPI000784BFE0|nr:DUF2523 family protein [Cellvibrio sp. OA-2007]